jgi:sugar phosphate isomerase/epimerase
MKCGFHSIYEENYFEAIDKAVDHGFDFVQFDAAVPVFHPENLSVSELHDIRKYSEDKDIRLTFHGPCDALDFFYDQTHIRKGITEYYKRLIENISFLNARHLTVHMGDYPKFGISGGGHEKFLEKYGSYFRDVFIENLGTIVAYNSKINICVENCGFDSFKMAILQEMIDKDINIKLTIDIAKAYNTNGMIKSDTMDFFIHNITHVREVHIHDFVFQKGSHQVIGTGFVDCAEFRDFLFKDDIWMNHEVRPFEAAVESRSNLYKVFQNRG